MFPKLSYKKIYSSTIIMFFSVVAVFMFFLQFSQYHTQESWVILFTYAVLTIMASILPIRTPNSILTLNNAVIYSAILLHGTFTGYWSAIIEVLILSFLFRSKIFRALTNAGMFLLTVALCGQLYNLFLMAGMPWEVADPLLALSYLFINTVLCALVITAFSPGSPLAVMKSILKDTGYTYLMIMFLSLMGARLVSAYGAIAFLPVLVSFVFIIFLTNQYYQSLQKLSLNMEEVKRLNEAFITSMAAAIDARDPYTHGHSSRVAYWGSKLAVAINLTQKEVDEVYHGGILHDVGKIGIEDAILNKEGKLTLEEYDKIKQHPVIGFEIVQQAGVFPELLPAIRWHHERVDGTGYPDGLKGTDIPLLARILAISDSFDAMVSDRPYRKGLSIENALKQIENGSGTQFDAELAKSFITLVNSYSEQEIYKMHNVKEV